MFLFSNRKKQRIVYEKCFTVEKCYSFPGIYYEQDIRTIVIETTRWWGTKYEVKQFYAKNEKPFFDGEYSSNERIEVAAQNEKNEAFLFIEKLKTEYGKEKR